MEFRWTDGRMDGWMGWWVGGQVGTVPRQVGRQVGKGPDVQPREGDEYNDDVMTLVHEVWSQTPIAQAQTQWTVTNICRIAR